MRERHGFDRLPSMSRRELTIAFCGDIMLGAEVDQCIGSSSVADWLSDISTVWRDADLLIGNLESPCVFDAKPSEGPPELIFRAPAYRAKQLAEAGFSAL